MNETPVQPDKRVPLSGGQKVVLTIYLAAILVAALHVIVVAWPPETSGIRHIEFFGALSLNAPRELQLTFLAAGAGAIGGFVHAASSFTALVGSRSDRSSWDVWYVLRPWIGGALAVIIFAFLAAGLLVASPDASTESVRPMAAIAFGGVAGFASKETAAFLIRAAGELFNVKEELENLPDRLEQQSGNDTPPPPPSPPDPQPGSDRSEEEENPRT